ncbi:hypothetical protein MMC09_002079 [Bachmanniomyces sp. S44760]|nr:hypothetical protein [Bachmanniomyces sp. S44760]
MSLKNVYHLRKVADASSKPCLICYKQSSSVLITPDNKDYFYVCPSHLKDKAFCSPIVDEAAAAAKKKQEALDEEIELVKKEYEEKLKSKRSKKKKDKEKEKDKDDGKKKEEDEEKKAEKERDDKIESLTSKDSVTSSKIETPRIYALNKQFYQMRNERYRNAEVAKRNQQRLKSPNAFPSVPAGDL